MFIRRGSIQLDVLNHRSLLVREVRTGILHRWLERSSASHMKHHVKFTNERVLTTIVEVLECGQRRTVCRSQCMVFFVCLFSRTSIATSFMYVKRIFSAESIGASPVIIACNTG